ncbi:hypothetical protein GPECTOR_2g1586 [Gonium pectorale]|uniref:TFIIE beta domain-containing protein n=1 Tax=Gonium pectorale TaxID=33097 RepID=A0A150H1U8_GONPE|nr:hypothetical protein GPECTOR_2g1586 [Gonium pectorale]|eukprot:KXZ56034.1 hypothetical protein GPECTOR_2g1586 [Gonium pectorale]
MGSLEELLSSINSGAVDVTASAAAAKRQPRKPKAQTELSKRLRGQTNAVNGSGQAPKPAEKRSAGAAAARATPPPAAAAAASAAAAGVSVAPVAASAAGPSAVSLGPPTSISPPSAAAVAAVAAPTGPPPVAADAPLTMRLKRVLDLLRGNRDPHTFADLKAKLHVDLNTDAELLEQLSTHSHVTYDSIERTVRYRPKVHGITNSNDLLNYLRRHTTVEGASSAVPMTGVKVGDVCDAYIGVEADIKRLQAEGAVFIFGHSNPGAETIYAVQQMPIGTARGADGAGRRRARPERFTGGSVADVGGVGGKGGGGPISESVNEMFHNTQLPVDVVDLQWRCRDLGLKSLLAARPVRNRDEGAGKDKKKKRRKVERKFNVEKATNAHMRELFEGAQPVNIDQR